MCVVIAVCGEALVDLVESGEVFQPRVGGSPANVAVALARLNVPVVLLARVSGDGFGRRVRRHLVESGVDPAHLVDAAEPTSLVVATVDEEGHPQYAFYRTGTADWQWRHDELPATFSREVRVLHTGSLALAVPPGAAVLEELMSRERRRGSLLISYDPNIRGVDPDMHAARRRVERQVGLAHIVKASAEDLEHLYPDDAVEDVARAWLDLGAVLVVITLGSRGAVARTASTAVSAPAVPVDVIDTIGAGDAFMAALLAGIAGRSLMPRMTLLDAVDSLPSEQLERLLREAAVVAALACTRRGADPPTRTEVDGWRNDRL